MVTVQCWGEVQQFWLRSVTRESDPMVPMSPGSQTQWCRCHQRVRPHGVVFTRCQPLWCHCHEGVRPSGVLVTRESDPKVSLSPGSQTQWCHRYQGVRPSGVIVTREADPTVRCRWYRGSQTCGPFQGQKNRTDQAWLNDFAFFFNLKKVVKNLPVLLKRQKMLICTVTQKRHTCIQKVFSSSRRDIFHICDQVFKILVFLFVLTFRWADKYFSKI